MRWIKRYSLQRIRVGKINDRYYIANGTYERFLALMHNSNAHYNMHNGAQLDFMYKYYIPLQVCTFALSAFENDALVQLIPQADGYCKLRTDMNLDLGTGYGKCGRRGCVWREDGSESQLWQFQ